MSTLKTYDAKGASAGTTTVPDSIFAIDAKEIEKKVPLIHQVVVAQLAAARQGTHKVKTRAEVSGGGRKPFKQKGTGRARQGSTRAPHMTGGGVVHGPTVHDYVQRTPRKLKAHALRLALSDRANNGRVEVIKELAAKAPKTTDALAVLEKINPAIANRKTGVLILTTRDEVNTIKSIRNISNVNTVYVDQINVYDVLLNDNILFTDAAIQEFLNKNKEA